MSDKRKSHFKFSHLHILGSSGPEFAFGSGPTSDFGGHDRCTYAFEKVASR